MKQKEFLDNSSGGSFTNNTEEEAWNLLETISEHTGNWDLDKGNEPYFDYGYSCVENFSTSLLFKNLSDSFNLDPYVMIEIAIKVLLSIYVFLKVVLKFMLSLLNNLLLFLKLLNR